jgi:hypothetical protein
MGSWCGSVDLNTHITADIILHNAAPMQSLQRFSQGLHEANMMP